MKNKSILVRVSENLDDALREFAREQNKPTSWIIREAMVEYLKSRGMEVKDETQWGGERRKSDLG